MSCKTISPPTTISLHGAQEAVAYSSHATQALTEVKRSHSKMTMDVQRVEVLVSKGQPRDTRNNRATKLCISIKHPETNQTEYHIFQLAGIRPHFGMTKIVTDIKPVEGPQYTKPIEIVDIPSSLIQNNSLLETVEATPTNQEWDPWTWLDDVFKRLQALWPRYFPDALVDHYLDQIVKRICEVPEG